MAELKEFERKMEKTLEILNEQFSSVRAGRANPRVLDRIVVEYYGTDTPIGQIATITSPDPRSLVIQPWDGSQLKPIEKAIQTSDLGINPQNDGRTLRLIFPQLTEERRVELTKQVKKYGEDAKVALRNVRRDAVDFVKKQQKNSEITEDDEKKAEKDIQDLTDRFVKKVDEACSAKEKELMEL
ncbi:MAG: ribosome recycling factor [Oscillospiraceae bacterium]|nr:ribosome recycling factor [Oscillospiraceae bacterium]